MRWWQGREGQGREKGAERKREMKGEWERGGGGGKKGKIEESRRDGGNVGRMLVE